MKNEQQKYDESIGTVCPAGEPGSLGVTGLAELGIVKFFRVMARHKEALAQLERAEAGELLFALFRYIDDLNPNPEFGSPAVAVAFAFIRPEIEEDIQRQIRLREKRQKAANVRWGAKKNSGKEQQNDR